MRSKKDILFLCQFFYPEYISSATLPFDTALALKKAGYSVDALCGYPHEYVSEEQLSCDETVEGIHIHRVKYIQMNRKSLLGRLVNYFSLTFMMVFQLFRMARYRSIIVYSNPPILPWVASWAKVLFGTKLVFVAYDLYPEIAVNTNTVRDGNIICRLMNHINKCVYQRADGIVALSSEMREYIIQNRKIDPDRVWVIHNWYQDNAVQKPGSKNNKFSDLVGDRFVVSYFGNMGIAQDMETIMEAVSLLKNDPNLCFLFAGHGNKMPQLKQIVEEKEIENIYIFDFLKGKDFEDALQISDCALISLEKGLTGLCVPSKTYSYMMQGIPLLAIMDPGDIVSDIEAGAGRWVRNQDGHGLAKEICFMKENPSQVENMRKRCRSIYLENYTTEVCTNKYVNLFHELLRD